MKKKTIVLSVICIENLETLKYHVFLKKTLVLSIICDECSSRDEAIFKEQESFEVLEIIGLINNFGKYQTNI